MTNQEELTQLVKDFIRILDIVEESDEGNLFRPNKIISCRALDSRRMDDILKRMKELTGE